MNVASSDLSLIQRIVLLLLMLAAIAISVDHTRRWFGGLPADIRAFYAAGQVVDQHADPFTVEPLLTHERALLRTGSAQAVVAPVPLPPYDLALFGLLARLPVKIATALFATLTIASGIVIGYALYQAARLPLALAIAGCISFGHLRGFRLGASCPDSHRGFCACGLGDSFLAICSKRHGDGVNAHSTADCNRCSA